MHIINNLVLNRYQYSLILILTLQLTSAVGEVQVTQPKSDYRNFRSQVPADQQKTRRSAGDDDFSHVVEIFNFPPEFKTHDLVAVLSPFKNTAGGFEIKWVDDTHALGVFAGALVGQLLVVFHTIQFVCCCFLF